MPAGTAATLPWVLTDPSEDPLTPWQRVRFSFETSSLRQAVELAAELRRITPKGVQVRPARLSRLGPGQWAVLMTTPPLGPVDILAVDYEMCLLARRGGGWTYIGWRRLTDTVEQPPQGTTRGTRQVARVLIVDDSPSFRRAARELLETRGYRVAGEADCAAAGVQAVERLRPDAVLLDVSLPDGCGLDVAKLLTGGRDAPSVLLVSGDELADREALVEACGACGFVAKAELGSVDLAGLWGA